MAFIATAQEKKKMDLIKTRIIDLKNEISLLPPRNNKKKLDRFFDIIDFSKILFGHIKYYESLKGNKKDTERKKINYLIKSFRVYKKKTQPPKKKPNLSFILKFD